MSQTFQLQLATDNLYLEAQQLGVSVQQLLAVEITVRASLLKRSQLHLNYQVRVPSDTLAAQLHWPEWRQDQIKFTDYLWEQTCLECFIADDTELTTDNDKDSVKNQGRYVEINASPSGRYALYQFDSYRSPSSLPPAPLLQPNKSERAYINWPVDSTPQSKLSTPKLNPDVNDLLTNNDNHYYERSFTIALDQLPMTLTTKDSTQRKHNIGLLHPCVILYFDKVALYFAPIHATPPDFHQSRYWTQLKL